MFFSHKVVLTKYLNGVTTDVDAKKAVSIMHDEYQAFAKTREWGFAPHPIDMNNLKRYLEWLKWRG